jgi:hypothetical protein
MEGTEWTCPSRYIDHVTSLLCITSTAVSPIWVRQCIDFYVAYMRVSCTILRASARQTQSARQTRISAHICLTTDRHRAQALLSAIPLQTHCTLLPASREHLSTWRVANCCRGTHSCEREPEGQSHSLLRQMSEVHLPRWMLSRRQTIAQRTIPSA